MAEATLRSLKVSWTFLCLRVLVCEFSVLSLAESISPFLDNDILQVYNVMNVYQCQRLCWYRKPCARYSFYTMNDNSGESEDNCVLHVTNKQNQGQMEGWILEKASSKGMPPDHGCLPRQCSETEICVPYKGGVTFQCIHAPGSDIDECAASPCQNGGSCVDQVNAYTCVCRSGYTGQHCQIDIDECASSPCQNGGSCVDQVNAYTCVCRSGYTGQHCQIDTDECASSPCQNGGSCVDQVNNYTCNCSAGYNGSNCETENWLASACSGTCAWNLTDCYSGFCLCRAGYYFSHSQYACVPTCNELQDTYLRYIHFDFEGFDHADSRHVDDVTECKSICSSQSWCLGIVFVPSTNECFLKTATAQQYPNHWGENDICDMYQRTCA